MNKEAKEEMTDSFRFRATPALKKAWDKMLEEHRITLQDASIALFEFILEEDPLVRAMIFKQVPVKDRADLSKLVLKRLGGMSREMRL